MKQERGQSETKTKQKETEWTDRHAEETERYRGVKDRERTVYVSKLSVCVCMFALFTWSVKSARPITGQ